MLSIEADPTESIMLDLVQLTACLSHGPVNAVFRLYQVKVDMSEVGQTMYQYLQSDFVDVYSAC